MEWLGRLPGMLEVLGSNPLWSNILYSSLNENHVTPNTISVIELNCG